MSNANDRLYNFFISVKKFVYEEWDKLYEEWDKWGITMSFEVLD
jgi:hypothetical protein